MNSNNFFNNPNDIYENDKLDRKAYVKNISNLLQNSSSPITFSINAPWGHGKTIFLEMLNLELKENKQNKTIKFSAWESDYVEEPLLAFLGEMNSSIKEILGDDKTRLQAWETTKKASTHILKRGIPVLAKLFTGGVLDIDKATEGELEGLAETLSTDLISNYEKDKKHLNNFKTGITQVLQKDKKNPQKLFILIDELDRCRPTYAIELLERIKHLFDIEGLVFVLAMDREQLSHSVKAVYGNEFESLGYLRRFIDLEFSLNQPEKHKFINNLLDSYDFTNIFKSQPSNHKENLLNTIILMSENLNLSLRDIEQLISKLHVISLSISNNSSFYPAFYVFLLVIQEKHPKIYNDFIIEGNSPKSAIALLYKIIPNYLRENLCARIEAHLICSKCKEFPNPNENQEANKVLAEYKKDTRPRPSEETNRNSDEVIEYKKNVLRFSTGRYQDNINYIDLNSVLKKINFVEAFNFSLH